MTAFIASPADWRNSYRTDRCLCCGDRALFHVENELPVCDDCVSFRTVGPGLPTETFPSDLLYHGDARGDYAR